MEPHDSRADRAKFIPLTTPSATWSGSASSNAISAFLPPSSSVMSFTPTSAASRWMARPVASLPMKPIRRTAGWRTSARPAAAAADNDRQQAGREDVGE